MRSTSVQLYLKYLRLMWEMGEYKLFEYSPSFSRPLLCHFEPLRFVRRVRFWLEYIGKGQYKVYYLAVNDDLVGHCVVVPGGRRLKCSTEDDVVIGPYFIKDSVRGKGYSEALIKSALENCCYPHRNVYCWIEKTNITSIRTAEACGFERAGELNVVGLMRNLQIVDDGEDWIYCLSGGSGWRSEERKELKWRT